MNKLIKNFAYQSSYQVLSIILPIITVPIVNKSLGVEGIGLFNYVTSITNYFVLIAGLGLAQYGIKEIAIARQDKISLSKKFWELQYFNLVISGLTFVVYLIFSFFTNYQKLFLINGALVLGTMFDISWFFAGIEDFKKIATRNIVIKLLSFLCIILFINQKSDLFLYFIIQAGSTLLSQISFWFLIFKEIKIVLPKFSEIFSHFKPALTFFLSKVSSTIINNSTKTMLGLLISKSAVGIFSNGILLVWVASTLISSINTVLLPRMSSIVNKDKEKFSQLINKSISIQVLLTLPIATGIIIVTPKMIAWFYGKDFELINKIIPILAIGLLFQQVHQAIGVGYSIPMNKMKDYNRAWVVACIILLMLNMILIPFIGVIGAAIAQVLTQAFLAFSRIIDMNKEIKVKLDILPIVKSLGSSFVMFLVVRVITVQFSSNIITTIFQVVMGVLIYIICSIFLKQHLYLQNLWKGKNK